MDLKQHLLESRRVSINTNLNETWIIFTDGAYEPSDPKPASKGGLLMSPNGKVISVLLWILPTRHLTGWVFGKFKTSDLWTWNISLDRCRSKFILKKMVVHYLDNDAARSAFIRANASTPLGTTLVADYIEFEYKCCFSPWFARVASHSNPSDQPSRLTSQLLGWMARTESTLSASAHVRMGNQPVRWQMKTKLNLSDWQQQLEARTKYAPFLSFSWKHDQPVETSPTVQTLKEKKGALYHSAIVCVSHVEHFIFWRGFDQNDGATAHFIPLEAKPHKRSLSKKQSV